MSIGEQPVPAVQLLHTLPDGSSHTDLMIAVDADGTQPLVTFRLPTSVDELQSGASTPVTALGEHRPAYLTYEGPVSGDRGTVRRLWRGDARWIHHDSDELVISLSPIAGGEAIIHLTRQVDDRWILVFAGGTSRSPAE